MREKETVSGFAAGLYGNGKHDRCWKYWWCRNCHHNGRSGSDLLDVDLCTAWNVYKACEIILGQRYRVKYENSMDEYMCDRSFVMKNALGWKKGAFILAICCFVLGPWDMLVFQTESVVNSLKKHLGSNHYLRSLY